MIAKSICAVLFSTALSLGAAEAEEGPIAIQLQAPKTFALGENPKCIATITNTGSHEISLVKPGDGSRCGWRTPHVGWSTLGADDVAQHPEDVPLWEGTRCGNMNRLGREEIVRLKPGETLTLDDSWIGSPRFSGPGRYRVKFYYRNLPGHNWKGGDLGAAGDQEAVKAMRVSTSCFAASNEVTITVTAKNPSGRG
jgi:hypothetical protein